MHPDPNRLIPRTINPVFQRLFKNKVTIQLIKKSHLGRRKENAAKNDSEESFECEKKKSKKIYAEGEGKGRVKERAQDLIEIQ